MIRRTTFCERPARGGSMTSTSGLPAVRDELAERQADVAREEANVVDLVALRVGDRVGDRLFDQFEAPDLGDARGHQQSDRADAAVQVVDALEAPQLRQLDRDSVEPLGHLGVRLKERLRGDPEAESAELLVEPVIAGEQLGLAAVRDLCGTLHPGPEHPVRGLRSFGESVAVKRARACHEPDLELAAAPALADHEVAQEALAAASVVRASAPVPGTTERPLRAPALPGLGGEQAVADLDDVVPAAGGVKAADEAPGRIGAERVLELVAVAPALDGRDDRLELVAVEPADPAQCLVDLRLLDLELALVRQNLPRGPGVVGRRRDPVRARLQDLDRPGLGVGAL